MDMREKLKTAINTFCEISLIFPSRLKVFEADIIGPAAAWIFIWIGSLLEMNEPKYSWQGKVVGL